jgi:4-amino-4-deoxy-L-arabinose transferase-like glycosyltransferase
MTPKKRTLIIVISLLIISSFLFLFKLGGIPLTDPDETFYAQTAKEMLEQGEWGTPLIFGEAQFEKPPLFYWMILLSYKALGVNEFAARLPSAMMAMAGILCIFFLGRILFDRKTGLYSSLIAATSFEFVVLARATVTDMALMVFILMCFTFFVQGWKSGRKYPYYLAAVSAALAVLTKGPIGLFIPGLSILLYLVFTGQFRKISDIPLAGSLIVFFAIALPWYILMTKLYPGRFVSEFFGYQNLTRFVHPEHTTGTSPFFYVPVIAGGFFPWSVFLPVGVWYFFSEKADAPGIRGYRALLLYWFLVVFLFFSASSTKLVTYIFPLWPPMAIVCGRLWKKFSGGHMDGVLWARMKYSYLVFLLLGVGGITGLYIFMRYEYPAVTSGAVFTAALFTAGLLVSILFFFRDKREFSFYSIVLSVILLALPLDMFVLPEIGAQESSRDLCRVFKQLARKGAPIAGESDLRRGVAFYADRTAVPDIQNYQKQIDFFSRDERVWGIIKKKHYRKLSADRPGLLSDPIYSSGKMVLVTNPGGES